MASAQLESQITDAPDPDATAPDAGPAGRSPTRIAMDRLRKDKIAVVSTLVVLFFVFCGLFAPLLTRAFGVELNAGDPVADTDAFNFPAFGPPDHGFTWKAPLGIAPNTAHDNLASWLYGARTSIAVATFATVVSTIVGVVVGLIAGFSRGWGDKVVTWMIDLFLSLPFLLVAIAVAPILTGRFGAQPDKLEVAQFAALLVILSAFGWMSLARLVRGEVLSLREREFIQAARVIGVPTRSILFRELLPNLIAPIVVSISLGLPAFVTAEAGLAYLGVGVVGVPSWGQTINSAVGFYDTYPLYLFAPVVGVLALVIALNLLGDAVRDAFDPKTRR